MAITSAQIAAVEQAHFDNADYETEASVSKCRAFLTACIRLLALRPSETGKGQSASLKFSMELLQSQAAEARLWLACNSVLVDDSASAVKHADFAEFRE